MFAAAKEAQSHDVEHKHTSDNGNRDQADASNNDSDVERVPRSLREARASTEKTKKGKKTNKRKETDTKETNDLGEYDPAILKQAQKYHRGGQPLDGKKKKDKKAAEVRSKKHAAEMGHQQRRHQEAAIAAARSEMLLTEEAGFLEAEGMERTYKFTQKQIAENIDISSSSKIFDLRLEEFGPYTMDYSSNGRHLLVGGRRGHLATMDWRNGRLGCELHVRETVRDVTWLHNQSLFAVAQKKHAYIYDHTGAEVHCLKSHVEPTALGFLPFHFLLVSTGMTGRVVFQDVTEGSVVGDHRPGYGPSYQLRVNPYNAVVHVGHGNGTVTLWSPKQGQPLARMLCHKGPVQSMAIDRSGTYMATSGLDGRVKVWDIRKFEPLHEYQTKRPAQSLDISQRGLLAACWGPHISVWKDALATRAEKPYMTQLMPSTTLNTVRFVPYDDVLGCGHSQGISSLVIPGAGEPNFDAYVANPYQTTKQRQESEVKSLLDKLAPETVSLDPNFIGRLDPRSREQIAHEAAAEARSSYEQGKQSGKYLDSAVRNKMKGRNSTAKRYQRKRQANVTDLKSLQEMEQTEREKRIERNRPDAVPQAEKGALGLFYTDKRNQQN
ncbi:putative U3 small nucleolar RNA-associated protein 7 [Coemansia sp. RSA 1722]|nr:putative U3 small nucleolar RNA-associated protein 7 [Coemansia sp. RSA 486]KAJ2599961.1 putative U3 small nucleolar RNA-associated protein 7 [Coemansia sp. RSA 1722]